MVANMFFDQVYYQSSERMDSIPDSSVDLIVTSPPYFNIKDYFKDGYQTEIVSDAKASDMGNIDCFDDYINHLLKVWKECERVLKPNGKLCINVPLMPMKKKELHTHYNRDIFDIQSAIITQNGNEHIKLGFVGDDITFTDFNDDELYCVKDENVLYDTKNQGVMLSYNKDLLDSYGTVS